MGNFDLRQFVIDIVARTDGAVLVVGLVVVAIASIWLKHLDNAPVRGLTSIVENQITPLVQSTRELTLEVVKLTVAVNAHLRRG